MTESIIREFRINSTYKGYYLIIDAVEFFVTNERRCIKITKDIYPYLSEKYQMPVSCVERNIRTVIELCWNNNSTKVRQHSKTIKWYFYRGFSNKVYRVKTIMSKKNRYRLFSVPTLIVPIID